MPSLGRGEMDLAKVFSFCIYVMCFAFFRHVSRQTSTLGFADKAKP